MCQEMFKYIKSQFLYNQSPDMETSLVLVIYSQYLRGTCKPGKPTHSLLVEDLLKSFFIDLEEMIWWVSV